MSRETHIPKELQETVREALGLKYQASFARLVQLELKADKTENKVLVLSDSRLFLLSSKSARKVETNIPLLDIASIESKSPQKLVIHTETKRVSLITSGDNAKEVDLIIAHVLQALSDIFPDINVDKLIARIDVSPSIRLKEIYEQKESLPLKDRGPCGNYSVAYRCMCDQRGVEPMEDVAWDVDNIYLSQDSREFCISDFEHVDTRHFLLILSALERNGWFTKLNISNIKLSPEQISAVRKVLKINSAIKELILVNSGIRSEIVNKLIKSLLANSSSALNSVNLSGNSIEDKGVKNLCALISHLPHGLVELHLSSSAITARGISSLGHAFSQSPNIARSLRVLDISENNTKGEDISNLLAFFAKDNVLEDIRLLSMDCSVDSLISSMYPGCCQKLRRLDVSGNSFSRKSAVCPLAWKQFFSSAVSLKSVNLSNCKLPTDAAKSVLLGIACNQSIADLELNLSGNGLGSEAGAAEVLEVSLPTIQNISSLDISDNGFDVALASLLTKLVMNKSLQKLYIGRNLMNIKPKNVPTVVEAIVQLFQEENSCIEYLSLENMRLKNDLIFILNALGTNGSLKQLDVSGNHMGDGGARILSKALLINNKLTAIYLDNNSITINGFQDIAAALEKNYTLQKMPVPLGDAANAHRVAPDKTELVFKKIAALLERNHSPRKLAMEQGFRLQQGLLLSSTNELLEKDLAKLDESRRKVCEIQQQMGSASLSSDVQSILSTAEFLSADVVASRRLLLELQKVVLIPADSSLQSQMKMMATQMEETVNKQIMTNCSEMINCIQTLCPTVSNIQDLQESIVSYRSHLNLLPEGFVHQLIVNQVSTEITNKLNELGLKLAMFLSDRVLENLQLGLGSSIASLQNVAFTSHPSPGDHQKDAEKETAELRKVHPSKTSTDSMEDNKKPDALADSKRRTRLFKGLRPQSSFGETMLPAEHRNEQEDNKKENKTNTGSDKTAAEKIACATVTQRSDSSDGIDEITLKSGGLKLTHLGKDRPKRSKKVPITHNPLQGYKKDNEQDLETHDQGINEFFTVKHASNHQNHDEQDMRKSAASVRQTTKPGKTK